MCVQGVFCYRKLCEEAQESFDELNRSGSMTSIYNLILIYLEAYLYFLFSPNEEDRKSDDSENS